MSRLTQQTDRYILMLDAVSLEILRAKELYPGDFHNAHEGFAVLDEERDELWNLVKLNPRKIDAHQVPVRTSENYSDAQRRLHRSMMREEAIQVAAMAIRFAAELT